MLPIILLTVVCVITYSFEIVFGLAGTILMLPVMSFFFDSKTLVIYSVLPQILVAVIGMARARVSLEWRFLGGMLVFAAAGAFAGFALFYYLSDTVFQALLASTITAAGLLLVIAPRRMRFGPAGRRVLDTLAGTSQALFGISGPIAMTRLLATFESKHEVRHYAFAFFLALNILRTAEYLLHGSLSAEVTMMMVVSAPFLALALWFASQWHHRLHEATFRRVVAWAILGGGITLFFH